MKNIKRVAFLCAVVFAWIGNEIGLNRDPLLASTFFLIAFLLALFLVVTFVKGIRRPEEEG